MNTLNKVPAAKTATTKKVSRGGGQEPDAQGKRPQTSVSSTDFGCRAPSKSRYAHVNDIARGGMGQVALFHDANVERQVAMKSLLPELVDSEDHIAEFVAEARVIGRLEHPNIVPLYDLGVRQSGDPYFTMQYVKGRTLAEVITSLKSGNVRDHRHFTWARRAQIIQQVCDAVAYAHQRGIAHRDLKPANIMLGEHGEVIVMDWGLAASSLQEELPIATNTVAGTPAYLCPEAITERRVNNVARDVYALGVLTYEFYSLAPPFSGTTLQAILVKVVTAKPKPIYEMRQKLQQAVPVEVHHITRRAMATDPEDRYATCLELRDSLQLYLDGRFPIRCPSTALKRWALALPHAIDNHPKVAVLIAFTTVLAGICAALALLLSR